MDYINIDCQGQVNHKEPTFIARIDRMAAINVTYQQLITTFGQPTADPNNDYYDVYWLIFTPDGVAKIHNFKDGKNYLGDQGLEVEQILEWEISCYDLEAVEWVTKALAVRQENEGYDERS